MADITVQSGSPSEVMTDERRGAVEELVASLRASGYDTDVKLVEYVPGRRGLTPVEWTYIVAGAVGVGSHIATKVADNFIDDLYEQAKAWALARIRRRGGGGRHVGVSIGTREEGELRRWHTGEVDQKSDSSDRDDSPPER